MQDAQGVWYLRVASTPHDIVVILDTGRAVEMIKMDNGTVRSRDLRPVPNASVLEAARQLYKPLSNSVQVSARAQEVLKSILNDKEILAMARIPVATAAAPAAPKAAAAAPATPKARKAAPAPKAAKKGKAAAPAAARAPRAGNDELMATMVVATKKAQEARKGSFWAQLGKLAAKPIGLGTLINKMLSAPAGVRSEKLTNDANALAASVRIRVRDAYNRLGFLKKA